MDIELHTTRLSLDRARAHLQRTLEEYCFLDAHLRAAENTNFRVCLFGSARITPVDPLYQTVFDLCRRLAERGMDVITGGGPGLMEAANAGARAAVVSREGWEEDASPLATSRSYGLTLDLPRLKEPANPHLDIKSSHKRFSSRLDEFVRLSHGVVVAPGGIGTVLELMYVWQLIQVGMIEPRPVILLGATFWNGFLRWAANTQAAQGFMSFHDLRALQVVDSVDEVVELMAREQALWMMT
jgi:uncharacterized protein (TIGR00730 family)